MGKYFLLEDQKREARDSPRLTQPRYDSKEEIQIIVDMGSSEDHALTSLPLSDGTIRVTILVT